MFSGAIFDVDGTLLDSMFIWDTAAEDFLRSRGVAPPSGLGALFQSMSVRDAAEYYVEHRLLAGNADDIAREINEFVARRYRRDVSAKAGARELLLSLKAAGVRLCAATASDRAVITPALENAGLADCLDYLLCIEDVGAGKDDPAVFLKAAALLGAEPQNILVFEDSVYAAKTAKAAGFCVAGVYDRHEKDRAWFSAHADYDFDNFMQAKETLL